MRKVWAGGLVALPCVVLAVMAWRGRWMSDDGFIHLQVARQVIDGHGPVFNVGERIEASTSPLWVALLVVASVVPGVAPPWEAVGLGILLSVAGLAAATQAGSVLSRRGSAGEGSSDDAPWRSLVLPVGAIVVACLPPFWEFATSGLETGLAFAWIGLSSWWTAWRATTEERPSRVRELGGAALIGLGPLIRPDMAVFSVAFGAVTLAALWSTSLRRRRLAVMAAMVALPGIYQVFRMGYYAMLVPNTAVAKDAGGARWSQGWAYIVDLVEPYWLWLPVTLLVVILVRQGQLDLRDHDRLRLAARLAAPVAGLVHAIYVTRFGGDFMHARLLLPGLFALIAPVALPAGRPVSRDLPTLLAPGLVAWAVVCAVALRPDPLTGGFGSLTTDGDPDWIEDERALAQSFTNLEHPVRTDLLELATAPASGTARLLPEGHIFQIVVPLQPGTATTGVYATTVIGQTGYNSATDVFVLDVVGLAHPVAGHLQELVTERPGHQKYLPLAWQVAQFGAVDEVRDESGQLLVTAAETEAARRAMDCGQLARYLEDIREPMTPARFLGNVLDSVANTFFRVPSDPAEAERSLCD